MKNNQGYFAISSAIILSLLVLIISVSMSVGGFNTRFNSLGFESRDRSLSLARGCLEEAFIQLRASSSYIGSSTITIGSSTCTIGTITSSGTDKIIPAEASVDNRTTNLEALYRTSSQTIFYIREKTN